MKSIDRWLASNFDRQVQIFPSDTLRTEYVVYRAKRGRRPRPLVLNGPRFSSRRVAWLTAVLMGVCLPLLYAVV
jgi:hypothetical protein